MVRALLLALAVLVAAASYKTFMGLAPPARRRVGRSAVIVLVTLALAVALFRFRLHWLPIAGALGWALVRTVLPLAARVLLPQFVRAWFQRFGGSVAPPGGDARSSANGDAGSRTRRSGMSREEALEILDLKEGATRDEILSAYRRLMKRVHPDAPGGSNYLAQKLNQAKDTLLGAGP